jgi:predicted acylesterase/phospholipase RssA
MDWSNIAGPPHALVLSGGGGNAAYEVGVLKALASGASPATGYQPIDPRILTGSSAGAFNAAVIASWPEYPIYAVVDHLENIWKNHVAEASGTCGNGVYRIRGNPRTYASPGCWNAWPSERAALLEDVEYITREAADRLGYLVGQNLSLEADVLQFLDLSAFLSPERYQRLLQDTLRPEAIRNSQRILLISVTRWSDGSVQFFSNADMTDSQAGSIVSASSALPGFFAPVQVNGEYYVDGGVVMDTPLQPAIAAGAGVLHVIYQDPRVDTIPIQTMLSLAGAFDRTYSILKARILSQDIDTANRINEGLEVLRLAHEGSSNLSGRQRALLTAAMELTRPRPGSEPYRKLTIHRYYPDRDVGGVTGILNFQRDRLDNLMELGYQDAARHDCRVSGCVLAESPLLPAR